MNYSTYSVKTKAQKMEYGMIRKGIEEKGMQYTVLQYFIMRRSY